MAGGVAASGNGQIGYAKAMFHHSESAIIMYTGPPMENRTKS